jgi:hypothetical protein
MLYICHQPIFVFMFTNKWLLLPFLAYLSCICISPVFICCVYSYFSFIFISIFSFFPSYFYLPPPTQVMVPELCHWLPCSVCPHPHLSPSPSSIHPARFQPCRACSYFFTHFFASGLLITLMTEAVSTSEMSVNFCETTQCNIPDDNHLLTHCYENLKSQMVTSLY